MSAKSSTARARVLPVRQWRQQLVVSRMYDQLVRKQTLSDDDFSSFRRALLRELQRVDDFFTKKEHYALLRYKQMLQMLHEQRAACSRPNALAALSSTMASQRALSQFLHELEDLLNFCAFHFIAFSRLIDKLSKLSGLCDSSLGLLSFHNVW